MKVETSTKHKWFYIKGEKHPIKQYSKIDLWENDVEKWWNNPKEKKKMNANAGRSKMRWYGECGVEYVTYMLFQRVFFVF